MSKVTKTVRAMAGNGNTIPMVATLNDAPVAATVNVTFLSGVGQLTTTLFRNGVLINMQSISNSGNIVLADVQTGDALAVVGVASGNARIAITGVNTSPDTPDNFTAGPIHRSYLIID